MKPHEQPASSSIFQRGRWGYDLFWIAMLSVMIAAPFPFLKTKKDHALDQIRTWQADYDRRSLRKAAYSGLSMSDRGPLYFSGSILFQRKKPPVVTIHGEPTISKKILESARTTLRRFLAIYAHINSDVFRINDVWIVRKVNNRVLLYFPKLSRSGMTIHYVYLWADRNHWLPVSLSLQSENERLYTFYFQPVPSIAGKPQKSPHP